MEQLGQEPDLIRNRLEIGAREVKRRRRETRTFAGLARVQSCLSAHANAGQCISRDMTLSQQICVNVP